MINTELSSKEFALMQKFIEERCGISLSEEKAYLIESRLSKLLIDSDSSSFEELYEKINNINNETIVEKVIDAITTNETLWFRDNMPWRILEDILLPTYIQQIREGKRAKVRIWSAACSTGQEPYSISMCINNYLDQRKIIDVKISNFEILATDISSTVLQIAALGRYDNISIIRGLDNAYKDKYFTNQGRVWSIDEKIKNSVNFKKFNLQNSFILLGKFDVIFCRNVIIYFSNNLKKEVMGKVAASLEPQGALFLGSSELFINYKDHFDMEQYNGGVYYTGKKG